MSDESERLAITDEWMSIAESDLSAAQHPDLHPGIRCYHAQQAAEKAMKATLVRDATDFPKTHHLDRLRALLSVPGIVVATKDDLEWLTRCATTDRYPGVGRDLSALDADRAATLAQSIVDAARAYIERQA